MNIDKITIQNCIKDNFIHFLSLIEVNNKFVDLNKLQFEDNIFNKQVNKIAKEKNLKIRIKMIKEKDESIYNLENLENVDELRLVGYNKM